MLKLTTFILPFGAGKYLIYEDIDPEDGKNFIRTEFWTDNQEDKDVEIERFSRLTSLAKDISIILNRDGWNCIPSDVKGILGRYSLLYQMVLGEADVTQDVEYLGNTGHGNPIFLNRVNEQEYAASWEGRLYASFEAVLDEISSSKVQLLGRSLVGFIPLEDRQRIQKKGIPTLAGIRFTEDEPWTKIDNIPNDIINKTAIQILYFAPSGGKTIVAFLRDNPRRFFWAVTDVFKLLSSIQNISGGWKH